MQVLDLNERRVDVYLPFSRSPRLNSTTLALSGEFVRLRIPFAAFRRHFAITLASHIRPVREWYALTAVTSNTVAARMPARRKVDCCGCNAPFLL